MLAHAYRAALTSVLHLQVHPLLMYVMFVKLLATCMRQHCCCMHMIQCI